MDMIKWKKLDDCCEKKAWASNVLIFQNILQTAYMYSDEFVQVIRKVSDRRYLVTRKLLFPLGKQITIQLNLFPFPWTSFCFVRLPSSLPSFLRLPFFFNGFLLHHEWHLIQIFFMFTIYVQNDYKNILHNP